MSKPIMKYAAGNVAVAIWENEIPLPNGTTKPVLKATVERQYKDKNDKWQSSSSFGRNEIALARHVLGQAYTFILDEEKARRANEDEVE